jgi:hypothetical protein
MRRFVLLSITSYSLLYATACGSSSAADAGVIQDGGTCPDGGGWSQTAIRIDGNGADDNTGPQLGIDSTGTAVVVWARADLNATMHTIWAAARTPDGTWNTAIPIDTAAATGEGAAKPALAVSANGSAVAVWEQSPNPNRVSPWATVRATSGAWGPPIALHLNPGAAQQGGNLDPQVAMDTSGNAVAVWAEDVGVQSSTDPAFGPQIYADHYTPGGGWAGPVLLSSYLVAGFCENPSVAVDDAGDAVVVFSTNPANSPIRAMAARYDGAAKTWSTASFIDACASCMSNIGILSRVAFDPSRNAIAVWSQGQSGGARAMWSARCSSTGAWSPAARLDGNLASIPDVDSPGLVIDGMGNATAIWLQTSNDPQYPNNIFTARYTAGAWMGAIPLDVEQPGANANPWIASNRNGDAMAIWVGHGIARAARYDAAASRWSAEVQLASQNGAGSPQIGILPGCFRAVAVYHDDSGQGGGNGRGIDTHEYK